MGPLLYRSALVSIGNRYLDTWNITRKAELKLGIESWVALGLRDDLAGRPCHIRPDLIAAPPRERFCKQGTFWVLP